MYPESEREADIQLSDALVARLNKGWDVVREAKEEGREYEPLENKWLDLLANYEIIQDRIIASQNK